MSDTDSRATRPSLLLRIRDPEDFGSWAEFARVYGPVIRGYCRRRGLQQADADDISQEVLTQVARSIKSFEYQPGRGRFRDWLGTVTRHKIFRYLEIKGRGITSSTFDLLTSDIDCPGEDPEWLAEFHLRILESALQRIKDEFEPRTWDVFERIWAGDAPAPALARDLGMTIDSVYAAKSRVLKRLREEVLALADELPCAWPLSNDSYDGGRGGSDEHVSVSRDPEKFASRKSSSGLG